MQQLTQLKREHPLAGDRKLSEAAKERIAARDEWDDDDDREAA